MNKPKEFWLAGEPNERDEGVWYDHHPGVHCVSGEAFHRYHAVEFEAYEKLLEANKIMRDEIKKALPRQPSMNGIEDWTQCQKIIYRALQKVDEIMK